MVFPLFLPLFLLFNVTIVQTVLFRCQQFSNSQTKRIALMAKDLRIGFIHCRGTQFVVIDKISLVTGQI